MTAYGNPVEGVRTFGESNDPLSKAIASGTQTAVTLSMQNFPKETTATLTMLAALGERVDATVNYLDTATGKVVSSNWNNLSPDTRHLLIGTGKITSLVFSPVGVGQIKGLITKPPSTPKAVVAARQLQKHTAIQYLDNNFYRDGSNPLDPVLHAKMVNQAAQASTHNPLSNEVVLGRFLRDSTDSYEQVALSRNATYFEMKDWHTVESQIGSSHMWSINKSFLDQQIKQNKIFVFTSDPINARPGSYTELELRHLRSNGYTIEPIAGGLFRARK